MMDISTSTVRLKGGAPLCQPVKKNYHWNLRRFKLLSFFCFLETFEVAFFLPRFFLACHSLKIFAKDLFAAVDHAGVEFITTSTESDQEAYSFYYY